MPNSTQSLHRIRALFSLVSIVLLSFSLPSAKAQSSELVKDLLTTSVNSPLTPSEFRKLGTKTLFIGCSLEVGCELWSTDGTAFGTALVKDILPGPGSSLLELKDAAKLNGKLYFSATDGVRGRELWSTDGTAAGTELFFDIQPGSVPGTPTELYSDGTKIYFSAENLSDGREPWVSDGTAAGTELLKNIRPGSSSSTPSHFLSNGSLVFFSATSASDGEELFATDGTLAGTYQVADISGGADGSDPSFFNVLGSLLIFSADDGVNGYEPWKSDGTAGGTERLANIHPTLGSSPYPLRVIGNSFLFNADNGVDGREVWKTDGTTTGLLKNIHPTSHSISYGVPSAVFAGQVYFRANDDVAGFELWSSDGTVGGTGLVMDINPSSSSYPEGFRVAGNSLYFSADDGIHGQELWVMEGSNPPHMVKDLDGADTDSIGFGGLEGVRVDGGLFAFEAGSSNDYELWITDGTDIGTSRLTNEVEAASSQPELLTPWLDGVAFLARDSVDGTRDWLYESDGTALGTSAQTFLSPNPTDQSDARYLTYWNGKLFLWNDSGSEVDLWSWDGSSALNIASDFGSSFHSGPNDIQAAESALVFSYFSQLYATDGSVVGDAANAAIVGAPVLCATDLDNDYAVLNDLIFYAAPFDGDCELWTTDLETGDSALLMDIDTLGSSTPEPMGTFGDKLIFRLSSGVKQGEVWVTDGTVAGTVLLEAFTDDDFGPGGGPQGVDVGADFLFIQRNSVTDVGELWKTQGTAASTSLVSTLPASPFYAVQAGAQGGMYFRSREGLWFSDGTGAGTLLIGPGFQTIGVPTVRGQDLIFLGSNTPGLGPELHLARGSEGLIEALPDIEPGPAGTAIGSAVIAGETLYVSAFRKDVGTELFTLDLSSYPSSLFADGFESGTTMQWSLATP